MAILQPIIDLVELCFQHGVRHAVISPGSRSAALSLAFDRHPGIETHIVMDERSAGFIALGMAQQLGNTVVLVCTSGSAAYNYAPAITEAFFQCIPLLVLTADRPPEWIHQQDGQTIYQSGIFGKHVKKYFDFPADYNHPDTRWYANRLVNEALLIACQNDAGPVHINVPIREPFYPTREEKFEVGHVRKIEELSVINQLTEQGYAQLVQQYSQYKRIMIAVGQQSLDEELIHLLEQLAQDERVVIVGESISNLPNRLPFVVYLDSLCPLVAMDKDMEPELLITLGGSFLSKSFKNIIRSNSFIIHWHVGESQYLIDSFSLLSLRIPINNRTFIQNIVGGMPNIKIDCEDNCKKSTSYQDTWIDKCLKVSSLFGDGRVRQIPYSDLWVIDLFLEKLPFSVQLHVANSMSVRYVNYLGVPDRGIKVFANRGTSGIDGCVSTAIGAAKVTTDPVYLLVGDVAFLYDRNGLLMEHLPKNLKILIINNSGGNIFQIIDGASVQPEVTRLFETRHAFTAEQTAKDSRISYSQVNTKEGFMTKLNEFIGSENTSILEVLTSPDESAEAFKNFRKQLQDWLCA